MPSVVLGSSPGAPAKRSVGNRGQSPARRVPPLLTLFPGLLHKEQPICLSAAPAARNPAR